MQYRSKALNRAATWLLVAGTFAAGLAWGQDEEADPEKSDLQARLAEVRREVKIIDLDTSLARVPTLAERENAYHELVRQMYADRRAGKDITALLQRGRDLKLAALKDLNEILKLHRGEHIGITEEEVWTRLQDARFADIHYRDEWLVNILDDLEDSARINIELDARIYKFDTVTFDFDKTSARAMLQMMGDVLLFEWLVRGDTLYIYKERHEDLFGGEWIKQRKAAWRARKTALEKAAKEAEAEALGEDDE
ncbi:MAG: hypothetical protein ACYTEZ_12145 [Planctomycetota bacterium]|jgi:hypothetical protein